jgi:hypothetical protein
MTGYDYYVTVHCPAAWEQGWVDAVTDNDREGEADFEDAESHYDDGHATGLKERERMTPEQIEAIRQHGNPFPRIVALN